MKIRRSPTETQTDMSFQGLKLALTPPAWRLLRGSLRLLEFDPKTYPDQPNFIFTCLHRDILPAVAYVRPAWCTLLVSNSPDGDILVKSLNSQSYHILRGGTGQDGPRALVALRKVLQGGGSIGLAVDGPKGPYGVIHEGAIILARLTGVPILPLSAKCSRSIVLSTWDRTVVPKPFSRVEISAGKLIHLRADSDSAGQARVKQQLTEFFLGSGGGA